MSEDFGGRRSTVRKDRRRSPSPSRRDSARRRGRSGGWPRWPLLLLLLTVAAVLIWGYRSDWLRSSGTADRALRALVATPGSEATLYFADPRWTQLIPERRAIGSAAGELETARLLLDALVEGPREGGAAVLPADTEVLGTYLGTDGLLVVDLGGGMESFDPGGASGELLTAYALVNTLALHLRDVRRVQILLAGAERETLAGHVKIRDPLSPAEGWIRPPQP